MSAGDRLALALELAGQGDWLGAKREAMRVLAREPSADDALLLSAEMALLLDPNDSAALRVLTHLSENAKDNSIRARSAFLAGRAFLLQRRLDEAWTFFAIAFQLSPDGDMARRSAAGLILLNKKDSKFSADHPGLLQQIEAMKGQIDRTWLAEIRPGQHRSWGAIPSELIVRFYRAHVSPAIGHRCSLDPSCSEYFLQAGRAHGWLSIPLIGDRLVREPGVVKEGKDPVERDGIRRYRDPVSSHTEWLGK